MNPASCIMYPASCILMLFLSVGCAPQLKANFDRSMESKIFWPGQPEKPRITYLWSLYSLLPEGSSLLDVLAGSFDYYDLKSAPMLLRPMYVHRRGESLYIADAGAQRVTVVNIKTGDLFHVGIEGNGELLFPVCVVTDRNGDIYVSDSSLEKVFRYDPKGSFIASLLPEGLRPVGLAYDEQTDTLYVGDTRNHAVHAVGRDGSRKFVIGKRGDGDGEFNYPTYVWVDRAGSLYVADSMNARIQVFGPNGSFRLQFGRRGGGFQEMVNPKGVATDSHGNIYVVDSPQNMVKIFNREGKMLLFLGDTGMDYGKYNLPNGIFIDHENTMYIADTYNMRVQAFQLIEGVK